MKSVSTIKPAIMENTEYLIGEVHASFINLKVGISLDHVYHYALFHYTGCSNTLGNIPSKE